MIYDLNTELNNFYTEKVKLEAAKVSDLKDKRNKNRKRLKGGLNKDIFKHIRQGSDAMHTTIQEKDNGYDIDDGVVFLKEDLKGFFGADKTPLNARKMVRDAIDDGSFKTEPEVKTNCVRVHYAEGYHVDIPVYRTDEEESYLELASSEWVESDPEGVTQWFQDELKAKHLEDEKHYQMRRMVRFFKAFGKSRPSWNMPSGFIWTKLISEAFVFPKDRDDQKLYDLMKAIYDRVKDNKVVEHPVLDDSTITKTDEDACMKEAEKHLKESIDRLAELEGEGCSRAKALKAWKFVFNTDYFDDMITKAEEDAKKNSCATAALLSSVGSNSPRAWGE